MYPELLKYGRSARLLTLLAFLSFNSTASPQEHIRNDSLFPVRTFRIYNLPDIKSLFSGESSISGSDTLIPARISFEIKGSPFLDTLETKASRYILTKKLYDLMVVNGKSQSTDNESRSSIYDFLSYSGKTIRNITIQRLDVFGTSINNPLSYDPQKIEAILNRTHLNTNELIIRKNLLFSAGDTVSPLTLSDNERLLRDLPYIDDSRIIVLPVSDKDVDILVLTRDVYSLGVNYEYSSIKKGAFALFERNVLGLGHEFKLDIPYNSDLPNSPGFGIEYNINNIARSFIDLDLFYFDGLGNKSYGLSLNRRLVSSETKYAGGLSVRQMLTTVDPDNPDSSDPLEITLQDYWLSRSFLINRESVSRIILGIRYTNNYVFDRPFILPNKYEYRQKYRMYLGSVSFSMQKFYKTSLLYGYGRTEDIPFGGLITITGGKEINEPGKRIYAGIYGATGHTIQPLGYFYTSAGFSTFFRGDSTEQGMLFVRTTYFTNLLHVGRFRMRNFLMADYTRGFDRNPDELLTYRYENGFSGFRNDSAGGKQRVTVSIESVLFSPSKLYGFRYAFFAFTDLGYLFGTNEFISQGKVLSCIGLGVRIRNDNLVFNTFQIRLGYFPNIPPYSRVNYLTVSGERMLKPDNFDPGAPTILPFR